MARSLTVNHTEQPATTPLFTAFLLLAFAVLALSALTAFATESSASTPAPAPAIHDR